MSDPANDDGPDSGSPARDRAGTERRILAAVGEVLARDGFSGLGINAIAREAGVDKVLLYRYFGKLPDLLAAYAERGDFWYWPGDLTGPPGPAANTPQAWAVHCLRRHVIELTRRPVTLEILAWEMVARNELTLALEAIREKVSAEVVARLAYRFPQVPARDLESFLAITTAATNYLVVRARHIRTFSGLDLARDAGWAQFFDAAERMAAGLFAPLPRRAAAE